MEKLVVYTCLFGDYGVLEDPFPDNDAGYQRICFTDDPNLRSDCWDIVVLAESGLGPRIDSRFPKLLPHRYLEAFDVSIYCDTRIRFNVSPPELARIENLGDVSLKCFPHPWRDCVYEEAETVIEAGICGEADVRRQMDRYRRRGYPEHNGLFAGTVILRRHNDPRLVELSELWHSHFLHYGHRDQLSFDFVAWLKGFEYGTFQGSLKDNRYVTWVSRSDVKIVPSDFDDERFEWMVPEVTRSGLTARQYFLEHWDNKKRPDKRYISTLNRLANKYRSDKGDLYYNAHGFAYLYDAYFSSLRNESFNLLEIGLLRDDVQARRPDGPYDDVPSLKMWREYFEKAKITGFDIADFSAVAPIRDVTILQGDMSDTRDLDRALDAVSGDYSIIIEDASHASHHQQIAFAHLFPKLMPGGYYVVEDLHYQPPELEEKDAVKMVDILRGLESGNLIGSKYLPVETQAELAKWIESVALFDSQDRNFGRIHRDATAVIKKRDSVGAASIRTVRRARGLLERLSGR